MMRSLEPLESIIVVQTRRGWFQEMMGCEAKTEFRYYGGTQEGQRVSATKGNEIFNSLEESGCCLRTFCAPNHKFRMPITTHMEGEGVAGTEILSIDRPCKMPPGVCKCCCYQKVDVHSGGIYLGRVEEQYSCCVPKYMAYDKTGTAVYKMHQPTCVAGMCVDICAEGNPCGRGCCKVPFHLFPANASQTDGRDASPSGKILKEKRSNLDELFTDSQIFKITFPEKADAEEKGLLLGATVLINANFFETGACGDVGGGPAGGEL